MKTLLLIIGSILVVSALIIGFAIVVSAKAEKDMDRIAKKTTRQQKET